MWLIYIICTLVGIFLFILNVKALFAILDIRTRLNEDRYTREYWIEKRLGNNEKACKLLIRMYYSEEFAMMMEGRGLSKKRKESYKGSFAELGYPEKFEELKDR
ncbi:hypothetical protein [Tannerella forsythia]|uniref:hypothetical protein n=1 Tax=Tannerella forsythia TaxID=28112 RepID=UPI000764B473|nr:hypothetical protein [Tannerella forsythia]